MLQIAPKGDVSQAIPLTFEEDRVLRAAFGRYGGSAEAREAAAAVVRRCQQRRGGDWFLCDCLPGAERPPALVPVSQTHIRRHQVTRWPVHCDTCDFYREPDEQREVTASYSAAAASRPLRLARPLAVAPASLERRFHAASQHGRRSGLTRLLLRLVSDAGLQCIGPGWRPPSLVDQVAAIWTAARPIEIDAGVRLTEFLCTSPSRRGELVARIGAVQPGRFMRTRPHGVLIARVAAIGNGTLEPVAGEPIPVSGRLAVFGERAALDRDTPADRHVRAPYLAICVLGRAAPEESIEVLSAYAHPCAAERHLMLLDSNLERHTLAQLRSLQSWLARKKNLPTSIDKPMFDVASERVDGLPRPPCIPDFVMQSATATAVVETMGYADAAYRERKLRVHPAMAAALGGPVLMHDFHEPPGRLQAWRDERFWRGMRWTLTRPERAADGVPPNPAAPASRAAPLPSTADAAGQA
ncbi:MAG: hypothetical protein J0H14_06865 [Alphaproteobacteria bacterium]|nr:hypothetical protein [Alphaproteobacteria bacterium]